MSYIYLTISFLFGLLGTFLVFQYGNTLQILDKPSNRSSHNVEMPKGGGIGILFSFLFLSIMLQLSFFFWLPAAAVALMSFYGDKQELSVSLRLFIQILCGVAVSSLFLETGLKESFLMVLLSTGFICATSNIYNFMDGIDGIAGINALVAFTSLAGFSWLQKLSTNILVFNAGMALSCLAFLFFNFPRAKVFMGDVGSILIGFVFSVSAILVSDSFQGFLCVVGFLFLFYFDSISTIGLRLIQGESIVQPHRKHIYQLLANEMGISHWQVSLLYGSIQGAICLLLIYFREDFLILLLIYGFCILLFSVISAVLRKKVFLNK